MSAVIESTAHAHGVLPETGTCGAGALSGACPSQAQPRLAVPPDTVTETVTQPEAQTLSQSPASHCQWLARVNGRLGICSHGHWQPEHARLTRTRSVQ
eukprot:3548541-Rhodomonas_salina.2